MSTLTFHNTPVVELVDVMGSDASVTRAARVSTGYAGAEQDAKREAGLIGYLMRERHGSPFEHAVMTFYVNAPIFVFREFQRHRIASYNERSGRYSELQPDFYVPDAERPLVNVGTSARPEFAAGTPEQVDIVQDSLSSVYGIAWAEYRRMVDAGIANEVARMVLPVGIFSEMYVTLNLRSLMNFLSLRVQSPDATTTSRPQLEIQQVAEVMEGCFAARFPRVHSAFVKNGRTAP